MKPNLGPVETIYEQEKMRLHYMTNYSADIGKSQQEQLKEHFVISLTLGTITAAGTYLIRQIAPESTALIGVGTVASAVCAAVTATDILFYGIERVKERALPRRIEAQRQKVKGLEGQVVEELLQTQPQWNKELQ